MYREGSGRAVIGTAGTAGPASCMTVKAREEKYLSRGPMEENYRSPVREKSYKRRRWAGTGRGQGSSSSGSARPVPARG